MHGYDKTTLSHDALPTPRGKLYAAMGLPPEAHARNWRAARHSLFGCRLWLASMAGKVTPHARKVADSVSKFIGDFMRENSLAIKIYTLAAFLLFMLTLTLFGFVVYKLLDGKSSINTEKSIAQAMRDEYGIGSLSFMHVSDNNGGVMFLLHGASEAECRDALPAVGRRLASRDIIVRVACEGRIMTIHRPRT